MASVTVPATILAGLVSFLSPCVLPLVPPYLSYLAGATLDEMKARDNRAVNRKALLAALLFVLGFSTVFVALGAGASLVGQVLRQHLHVLSIVAGLAIVVMGLHFLGLFRIAFLSREARVTVDKPAGLWGAYVMGLAFAFGWTPCIGPVLAAVLALAGSEGDAGRGAVLLAFYSLGLGVPFLLAAFAMKPFVAFLKRFRTGFSYVEKTMGVLLVLTGIGFLTGWMTTASFWLLETFPLLGQLG